MQARDSFSKRLLGVRRNCADPHEGLSALILVSLVSQVLIGAGPARLRASPSISRLSFMTHFISAPTIRAKHLLQLPGQGDLFNQESAAGRSATAIRLSFCL